VDQKCKKVPCRSLTTAVMLGWLATCVFPATTQAGSIFGTRSVAQVGASTSQSVTDVEPFSSTASALVTGFVADCYGSGPTSVGGAANASADLFSGVLRASASGEDCSGSTGNAEIYETITVLPPAGGGGLWSADGTLGFTVDSTVQNYGGVEPDTGAAPGGVGANLYWAPGAVSLFYPYFSRVYNQCPSVALAPYSGACNFTLQFVIPVSSSAPTFTLYMTLQANGGWFGYGDASNTGQAFLTLPPGYSFESASGVFLTSQGEETPEPWPFPVLGAALLGLGAVRLRKTRWSRG